MWMENNPGLDRRFLLDPLFWLCNIVDMSPNLASEIKPSSILFFSIQEIWREERQELKGDEVD